MANVVLDNQSAPTTPSAGVSKIYPTTDKQLAYINEDGTLRVITADTYYFRLTASGTGITTIADFFGTNDGIPLVANGIYFIEWDCWLSQATASTNTTFTIVTATTNLANLNAYYVGTPLAGIGTAGNALTAAVVTTNSSSTALPVTGSLANAVTHHFNVRAFLTAGNGSSNTRLRLTSAAGTATPLINSFFRVQCMSSGNTGTFVA